MIDDQGYEPPEEWDWHDPDHEPKETKCGHCGHTHMCGVIDNIIWVCQWCWRFDHERDPQGLDKRPKPWTLGQKLKRLEEDNPAIAKASGRLDEVVDNIIKGKYR